ncbi:DcuS/MalK family sensor histidine kinase [Falsibacillus albus]|uniref:histidine kinase n=1 Tax=Falsibacillus albus TaxID=2478915 RepID=A0A3L7JU54_9BACI|nr:DcuS/MalK family sensor histidine kinase [Falsibacillus albus]RLQ93814.1 two-component system sensor histidine kinase DcuS [Falsibacillus albus]
MRIGKLYVRLHFGIALFVCSVVIAAIMTTGLLIGINEVKQVKENETDKAMTVAKMVSHSPLVINSLSDGGKGGDGDIQSYTQLLQKDSNVRFIVVMDMNHIRKSHPDPYKIGKPFVGGDEDRALHGEDYVSIAKGTLGTSLRAFAPVYDSAGKQVGAVSVGILMSHVAQSVIGIKHVVYLGIGIGILIGIISALILSKKIKHILLGLEPFEIANILQERNAMLESVREGIIAVDKDGAIVVANAEAVKILTRMGIEDDLVGRKIDQVIQVANFERVWRNGKRYYDQEITINGLTLVMNTVPVSVEGELVGLITTFRDRTELKRMAEQLTGVKMYADSLRAKTHEFMNKLHVILGLVHIEAYEELNDYVRKLNNQYKLEIGQVSRIVKDPIIAGLLLSKLSFAREQGVEMTISGEGLMSSDGKMDMTDELVTILGNLIDNGIEAVHGSKEKVVKINLESHAGHIIMSVKDSGPGIADEMKDEVVKKGFSTKGENNGYGLYLVQQSLERINGTMDIRSDENGTMITVDIPMNGVKGNVTSTDSGR